MKNVIELRIFVDCDNKTYSILNESRCIDNSSRYVLSEGYLSSTLFSDHPDSFNYSESFESSSYEDNNVSPLGVASVLSAALSQGDGLKDLNELEDVDELEDIDRLVDDEDNIHIY